MNRRNFLKTLGAVGALSAVAPQLLRSSEAKSQKVAASPKRLIVVLAQGGWDTTYALDPKVQSADVDVPVGTTQRFGGIDIFADASRPNVSAYFTKYAALTAVVRGINVGSVSHLEAMKRMATGTREERNADVASIVAHDLGNAMPLPYLVLGETAFTGPYAASAGRVGATNQLITLLDPTEAYKTAVPAVAPTSGEAALLARYAAAGAARVQATRGAAGYNRRRVQDFADSLERGERLKAVREGLGRRGKSLALVDQVDVALDALSQDVAFCTMLSTRAEWDTHDTNIDQSESHETTFAGLTRLLDGLNARKGIKPGTKMIDDTVVLCFAEFGRTPKLNSNQGKDHWPVTAAMVMGGGVAGGRMFGATNASVQPEKIDYATGAASASGKSLASANFAAGVLNLCGVNSADHLPNTEAFDAFVA